MNYEGQICRGPMERSSYMLPVAVGCSYNRCKFCTLFRHLKYRELPMEQIEAELERVRSLGGNPKHVFLGDGNAFGLATKRLLEITDLIHCYFPGCQAIMGPSPISRPSPGKSCWLFGRQAYVICIWGLKAVWTMSCVIWERTTIWTRHTVRSTASKGLVLYSTPIS